jgi:hypothetical protein
MSNTSNIEYNSLHGKIFTFYFEGNSDDIFSREDFVIFTYELNCGCYNHIENIKDKKLLVYVKKAEKYETPDGFKSNDNIIIEQIFYEIDNQIDKHLQDLRDQYKMDDVLCEHSFIDDFEKYTSIQYNIICGM